MTPRERRSLAEQLTGNPLLGEILDGIERSATERLIYADTETRRIEAQAAVKAARAFRQDITAALAPAERRVTPA